MHISTPDRSAMNNNWTVLEEEKAVSVFWMMMQRLMLMNLKMVLLHIL